MLTIEELAEQLSNLGAIVTNNTATISNVSTIVANNVAEIVFNAVRIQNNTNAINQNINVEEDDGSGTGSFAIAGLASSAVVGVAVFAITCMVIGTGRKSEKERAVDNEKIDTEDIRDKSVYYETGSPRKLNVHKHITKSNTSHKSQVSEIINNEHSPEAANVLAHGAADSWNGPTAWQGKAGFISALGEAGAKLHHHDTPSASASPTQPKHVQLDLSQTGNPQNGQRVNIDTKKEGSNGSWETDKFFTNDGNWGSFRSSPKHADTPKASAVLKSNTSKPVTAFPDYVKTFTPTNIHTTPDDNVMIHHPANTYVAHGYSAPTSTPTSGANIPFDPNRIVPYPMTPTSEYFAQPQITPMGDVPNYTYTAYDASS